MRNNLLAARQLVVVLLVTMLFFLLGCSSGPGDKAGLYNFKQGVAEVEFRLLENAPPENIYPGSSFQIVVEADNQAAYDITDGTLQIIGLDEKYFIVAPLQQSLGTLAGRSLTFPSGDKKLLEFSGTAGNLYLEGAEEYTGNFFLTASYRSTMEFADTICVNSQLYEVYDAGCKVESPKSYDGQGAPLAVTEVEEIIAPQDLSAAEFRVHVKNVGQGQVTRVLLRSAKLGAEELSCHFQDQPESNALRAPGEERFISWDEQQEAVIFCTQSLSKQGSYTTTLSLDFVYEYEYQQEESLHLVK